MQRKENPQVSTLIGNCQNYTYWTPFSTMVLISTCNSPRNNKICEKKKLC